MAAPSILGAEFGSGLPWVAARREILKKEHAMFERLNGDRAEKGLAPLLYDKRLADIARVHSADMKAHRFFAHESPRTGKAEDRLIAAGYLFQVARENLAEAPDIQRAEDGLLKSPKHYENIMSTDVARVGIGIVEGGVEDPRNILLTQEFALPGERESARAARRKVLEAIRAARRKGGLKDLSPHKRLDAMVDGQVRRMKSPPEDEDLQSAGKAIREELEKKPMDGVRGVSMNLQFLSESAGFKVVRELLKPETRFYGVAVRQVVGEKGIPRLMVLVLVGK